MAEIKWIKLSTGLPDSRKIKQMRKLPEGDSIALMWVFLMCLAGETNADGLVYFTPEIPYTEEMLADQFSMDINTVRLALKTYEHFGMIDIIDNMISLTSWEKWQAVDKMSEIREYNRLAKRKSREKQRLLRGVNDASMTSQPCQGTEEDKEKEEDKEIESKDAPVALPAPKRKVFQKPSLEDIKAYCKEGGYSIDAQRFLDYYESNGWMVGRNKMKDWKAAVRSWASRDKKPKVERDYGDPEDFYK